MAAWLDVEIPRRYGVDQPVGDTLEPGGVFRALRTIPVLVGIARDMQELCANALLIQYANPLAMNCWAMNTLGIRNVGQCHSVHNTSHLLARRLGLPYGEIRFIVAGINHQAWFLHFAHGDTDMYLRLRQVREQAYLRRHVPGALVGDNGDHSAVKNDNVYEGSEERVRTEIMRTFGYFHTESSHHASEYVPYFRKNAAPVQEVVPQR